MLIDKLVSIYNRWGDLEENKNLQPLESAQSVLLNKTITKKQTKWIERFLEVWKKSHERDYKQWKKSKGILSRNEHRN